MNLRMLIDGVVRQTTVLIAHHRQGLDLKVLVVSCTGYALLLGGLIPRFGY